MQGIGIPTTRADHRRVFAFILTAAIVLSMMALPATADHPSDPDNGPLVDAEFVAGNQDCGDLLADWDYEFKIDESPISGKTYSASDSVVVETGGTSGFEVTITTSNTASGQVMAFASNIPVQGVFVKGGPNGNLYDYLGAGLVDVVSDANLHAPVQPPGSGTYAGISHVSFCFEEPPIVLEGTLGLEKTAEASYDREVEWELEKTVDPNSHTGNAGEDAGSSEWEVVATKVETESNFMVTGEIDITWLDGDFDLTVAVDDVLDDGTLADVDCGDGTNVVTLTAPNDAVTCTYVAMPTDTGASLNTVALDPIDPEGTIVGDLTATAPVDFVENLIGDDEVTLSDERFEYSQSISETTEEDFPETFPCPADPTEYEDGVHQRTETNIATLVGDTTNEVAEAEVLITCTLDPLEAAKTAEGSYDRTVVWTLDKEVDPDSHTGGPGDVFSSDWTVTATKVDSGPENFAVSGTITVTNDTAVPMPFGVTDELNDGTVADVTCPSDVVAAGESVICTYEAFPDDDTATLNTATISAPGNDDVIATAGVVFVENLTGDDEVTLEDDRSEHEELIDSSTTLQYDEEFACPTDPAEYEDGSHTFDVTNTATLMGENTNLTATATVTVECFRVFIDETVTGAGDPWSEIGASRKERTNTWFEYTVTEGEDGTHDLIQGRKRNIVGEVAVTNNGDGTTTLSFSFDAPWQLADVAGNVKVEPLDDVPSAYISPGQFSHHFTEPSGEGESFATFSVEVPTASYGYAIHLDAGSWADNM